jgi:hypothetical protein
VYRRLFRHRILLLRSLRVGNSANQKPNPKR